MRACSQNNKTYVQKIYPRLVQLKWKCSLGTYGPYKPAVGAREMHTD